MKSRHILGFMSPQPHLSFDRYAYMVERERGSEQKNGIVKNSFCFHSKWLLKDSTHINFCFPHMTVVAASGVTWMFPSGSSDHFSVPEIKKKTALLLSTVCLSCFCNNFPYNRTCLLWAMWSRTCFFFHCSVVPIHSSASSTTSSYIECALSFFFLCKGIHSWILLVASAFFSQFFPGEAAKFFQHPYVVCINKLIRMKRSRTTNV